MMLKDSVRLGGLLPQTVLAYVIAESVFQRVAGSGCRMTSCNDSQHGGHPVAGENKDPHYTGRAIDLGIKEIPVAVRGTLVNALGAALGTEYDVLWEARGTDNEHLHIQYTGVA